jgi:hypothetical protein
VGRWKESHEDGKREKAHEDGKREKAHEDGKREKAHRTEMWKEVNAWGRSCHVVDLELKVVGGAAVQ